MLNMIAHNTYSDGRIFFIKTMRKHYNKLRVSLVVFLQNTSSKKCAKNN